MPPAAFLQMVNKTIRAARSSEEIEDITSEEFVRRVAEELNEDSEVDEENLNSISRRVEGSMNESFPALSDILSHITNVITDKLGAY